MRYTIYVKFENKRRTVQFSMGREGLHSRQTCSVLGVWSEYIWQSGLEKCQSKSKVRRGHLCERGCGKRLLHMRD